MKPLKIKKGGTLVQKSIYSKIHSRRIMDESKFWQKIALQQQAILHAKYQT